MNVMCSAHMHLFGKRENVRGNVGKYHPPMVNRNNWRLERPRVQQMDRFYHNKLFLK